MRCVALLLLLTLTACTGGNAGATDAQTAIATALDVIEAGINSEDAILASQPIGDQFFLGANVGTRFSGGEWKLDDTPAIGRFRTFFNTGFTHLANERLDFTITSVQVNGDVATAVVQTRFDAVRTDSTPAENVTYNTTDYMLFELQHGGWRLIRWDEQPPAS